MHIDTLESLGAIMKSKTQNHSLFGSMLNLSIANGSKDSSEEEISNQTSSEKSPDAKGNCSNSNQGLFDDLLCREVGFIMLQFVGRLKNLQAKGIEEMPISLSNVILCKETDNKEAQARLCVLQG